MLFFDYGSPQKKLERAGLVLTTLMLAFMPFALAETYSSLQPAIGKGDCLIAYRQSSRKRPAHKVMKKDGLSLYKQKVPSGPDGEVCSKEMKDFLRIDDDDCMIYCNAT